jgi:hypothetical protein
VRRWLEVAGFLLAAFLFAAACMSFGAWLFVMGQHHGG